MRTPEELEALYAKFDNDVATKSKGLRVLIALDQLIGTIIWNTSQDETISSHIGRLQEDEESTWFDDKVCCVLSKLEYNHCNKSKGE